MGAAGRGTQQRGRRPGGSESVCVFTGSPGAISWLRHLRLGCLSPRVPTDPTNEMARNAVAVVGPAGQTERKMEIGVWGW